MINRTFIRTLLNNLWIKIMHLPAYYNRYILYLWMIFKNFQVSMTFIARNIYHTQKNLQRRLQMSKLLFCYYNKMRYYVLFMSINFPFKMLGNFSLDYEYRMNIYKKYINVKMSVHTVILFLFYIEHKFLNFPFKVLI